MKNLLLPEPQKTEHEVIIAEIETADKAKKGPTEFSKWSRVKSHVKRNKEKYIAGAVIVTAAIAAAVIIKSQNDKISDLADENDLLHGTVDVLGGMLNEANLENVELFDRVIDAEAAAFDFQQELEGLYNNYNWMNGGRGL